MDEVHHVAFADTAEHGRGRAYRQRAPADIGDANCGVVVYARLRQTSHRSRDQVEPRVVAEFLAPAQQDLAADAYPQHRRTRGRSSLQRRGQTAFAESLHRVAEGAHARQDDSIRLRDTFGRLGDFELRIEMAESLSDAEEVAPAVVDNDDHASTYRRTRTPDAASADLRSPSGHCP